MSDKENSLRYISDDDEMDSNYKNIETKHQKLVKQFEILRDPENLISQDDYNNFLNICTELKKEINLNEDEDKSVLILKFLNNSLEFIKYKKNTEKNKLEKNITFGPGSQISKKKSTIERSLTERKDTIYHQSRLSYTNYNLRKEIINNFTSFSSKDNIFNMNKRRNNLIFDDNSIPDNQKPLLGNLYTHTSEKLTNENPSLIINLIFSGLFLSGIVGAIIFYIYIV